MLKPFTENWESETRLGQRIKYLSIQYTPGVLYSEQDSRGAIRIVAE